MKRLLITAVLCLSLGAEFKTYRDGADVGDTLAVDTAPNLHIYKQDFSSVTMPYQEGTFVEYDPNTITVEDVFVRQLAKSGRICEVLGHQWASYMYTLLDYRPHVVADERCGLCKITRVLTQEWSVE